MKNCHIGGEWGVVKWVSVRREMEMGLKNKDKNNDNFEENSGKKSKQENFENVKKDDIKN